jgi:hypothetical protein
MYATVARVEPGLVKCYLPMVPVTVLAEIIGDYPRLTA